MVNCFIIFVNDAKYNIDSEMLNLKCGFTEQKDVYFTLNISDSTGQIQSIRDIMFEFRLWTTREPNE